jgi:hypothetical protein
MEAPGPTEPGRWSRLEQQLAGAPILPACGLAYFGLGVVLGLAYFVGGVRSSLFPTGWLFPAVLVVTGILMTYRRRFDIVMTMWGVLTLAAFLLDFNVYMLSLELGFNQPAGFDSSLIVAVFALVPLILRPQFGERRPAPS